MFIDKEKALIWQTVGGWFVASSYCTVCFLHIVSSKSVQLQEILQYYSVYYWCSLKQLLLQQSHHVYFDYFLGLLDQISQYFTSWVVLTLENSLHQVNI